jgi:hypothetical protein
MRDGTVAPGPDGRGTLGEMDDHETNWQAGVVTAIAHTGGMPVLDRLGTTLGETCRRLVEHLRTATNDHEHDLLDRLLCSVGAALVATRHQRFVVQSREERERTAQQG